MTENEISRIVVECAIEVHRTLGGPGLLESIYEEALAFELEQRGLKVRRQVAFRASYKGRLLLKHFRLDMIVEDLVIVDTKATSNDDEIYRAQVLTYLRLLNLKLGLVINFGQILVKNGIQRVINGQLEK